MTGKLRYHQSLTQPLNADEGDYWVDPRGNILVMASGTWILVGSAYREKDLEKDILPEADTYTLGEIFPYTEENIKAKLAIWE